MIDTFLDFICSSWLISTLPRKGCKQLELLSPKSGHRNCNLSLPFCPGTGREEILWPALYLIPKRFVHTWKEECCIEAKKTAEADMPCWVSSSGLLGVGDNVKSSEDPNGWGLESFGRSADQISGR